ncbi:hypothetical protein ACF3NR_09580 [Vaginella massiliensis]|uniref:hypothetical protein n=1 Tax=Vaginella massiliensis TaxID=1816680 RepID=UPI00375065D8
MVENAFFGNFDHFGLQKFLCRTAGFFFDEVAKIVGRKVQFFGAINYRRQPDAVRLVRVEVVVEQLFDTGENVAVSVATGDKLAVVEKYAVIQKEFYILHDERFAVADDVLLNFFGDFF